MTFDIQNYLKWLPQVKAAPQGNIWLSYDAAADVFYVNFQHPNRATDSELTDDDVILRYGENDDLVGFTILRASQR